MLARIRKSAEQKDSGFTLIELLVVMIIIGILAAIAIPAFLSQKNKAKGTSAKADVTTIGKEISAWFVDNPTIGATPPAVTTATGNWSFNGTNPATTGKLSADNVAAGTITSATGWCVWVYNTTVDTTAPAAGAQGESAWKYTQDGLSRGACA